MIYKIKKHLIVESYLQDLINGVSNEEAIENNGESLDNHLQDEKILGQHQEPTKGSNILKSKYDEFNKNSLRIIRDQSERFGLPYEKSVDNSHRFMKTLGNIENSGKTVGDNGFTSAKGLYQNTNDSVTTGINRINRDMPKIARNMDWIDDAKIHKDANQLSRQQQTNLTMGSLAGHGNGKRYFDSVLDGDVDGQKKVYNKMHHTNPNILTARVRDREFDKQSM